eukprot:6301893-Amphidinium_carterae.1
MPPSGSRGGTCLEHPSAEVAMPRVPTQCKILQPYKLSLATSTRLPYLGDISSSPSFYTSRFLRVILAQGPSHLILASVG